MKKQSTAKKQPAKKAQQAPAKKAAPRRGGDEAILERYNHHRGKIEHHRAQADLIEAKLRAQGKEIRTVYPGEQSVAPPAASVGKQPQRRIVPKRDMY